MRTALQPDVVLGSGADSDGGKFWETLGNFGKLWKTGLFVTFGWVTWPLQWLEGHFTACSALGLTGSSLGSSEDFIRSPTPMLYAASNRSCEIRLFMGNRPQNIFRPSWVIPIISIPWPQTNLFSFECLFLSACQAQGSSSALCAHFIFVPCYKRNARRDTFFMWSLLKEASCPNFMCHCATNYRRSCRGSSLLHSHAPYLNPEHQWLSAQSFFSLITLFSWFISEKKLVHTLS